jgi:hypothetical protein
METFTHSKPVLLHRLMVVLAMIMVLATNGFAHTATFFHSSRGGEGTLALISTTTSDTIKWCTVSGNKSENPGMKIKK